MIFDIILLLLALSSFFNGYKKGLIVASFNLLSLIICFLIAFTLNAKVASYLSSIESLKMILFLLPVLSFILVFFIAKRLLKFVAKAIKQINDMLLLGFFDKIGGAILMFVIDASIIGVILYFIQKIDLLPSEWFETSKITPAYIATGSLIIDFFVSNFQVFKDYFLQLKVMLNTTVNTN